MTVAVLVPALASVFFACPLRAHVFPARAHALAMYGEPALPPDAPLPYANPKAPKGGRLVLGEVGSFDSLIPFILRVTAPAVVSLLTVESLLFRSWDEPFTLYGFLAESVETDAERSYVAFTLRENARFSDGSPVTVEDVVWSLETLGARGHARYRAAWSRVRAVTVTGSRTVRVDFVAPDRELPLILGLRSILKRAQFDEGAGGQAFEQPSLTPIIGSGPYVVASVEAGRSVTLRRNPDWWARDLPLVQGLYNFDEIRWDYFGDAAAAFEAFKSGALSIWREPNPARWRDSYDFPAVREGRIRRAEIPHGRPSGMDGLVINTRRPPFDDWRVREALVLLFDFAHINTLVTGGEEPRITSPFANSVLAHSPGTPAEGREAALLAPFAQTLPPGALEGWSLPATGRAASRQNRRRASALLDAAGWIVDDAGIRRNAEGQALQLSIVLPQGSGPVQIAATVYSEALRDAGIQARIELAEPARLVERLNTYDFDLTYMRRAMSLSPGYEQFLYWGSEGRTQPGTRNLAGLAEPAVDALIRVLVETEDPETFIAAARALDRVLMATRTMIPFWYSPVSRIAYDARLRFPERLPIYGDWIGFLPDVWWMVETER